MNNGDRGRRAELTKHLALGHSNKQIAFELGLTHNTVKSYLSKLSLTRYDAVKTVARDHERVQAIRLNGWIQKWGGSLPVEALEDIRAILSQQVADVLR